jgi:hypothetical protein
MARSENAPAGDSNDVRRVSNEYAGRLATLGIRLTGTERPDEIVKIVEAVERFERAVESHGGDLMVDEGPRGHTTEPDDPHFALPLRADHESVGEYLERLARATDEVRRHPPRAD